MFASLHTSTLTVRRVQSRGTFNRLFESVVMALNARSQRRKLASLDDAALADIGLSRAQAAAESGRPLWDVPVDRRV